MLDPGANSSVQAGRRIPRGGNGRPVGAGDWSREPGRHLAEEDSIAADDRHWPVIMFIRAHHGHRERAPLPKVLGRGLNTEAGEERHDGKFPQGLFPDHPMRRACRSAWCT